MIKRLTSCMNILHGHHLASYVDLVEIYEYTCRKGQCEKTNFASAAITGNITKAWKHSERQMESAHCMRSERVFFECPKFARYRNRCCGQCVAHVERTSCLPLDAGHRSNSMALSALGIKCYCCKLRAVFPVVTNRAMHIMTPIDSGLLSKIVFRLRVAS